MHAISKGECLSQKEADSMDELPKHKMQRTGYYERAVDWVTARVKSHLHDRTEGFIEKSIEKYARGNPRYANIIAFEVKRRGDGAGITQDVAEPLVWTFVKTTVALAIIPLTEALKAKKVTKMFGYAVGVTALASAVNNMFELFRLKLRFTAGLQGSRQMALDRIDAIEKTGIDPFGQQGREIGKPINILETATHTHAANHVAGRVGFEEGHQAQFAKNAPQNVMAPDAIQQQKADRQQGLNS